MMWNLQSYPTTVLNETTWHFFGGIEIYSDPYILKGGGAQDPATPQDLRLWTSRDPQYDHRKAAKYCSDLQVVQKIMRVAALNDI